MRRLLDRKGRGGRAAVQNSAVNPKARSVQDKAACRKAAADCSGANALFSGKETVRVTKDGSIPTEATLQQLPLSLSN